MVYGCGKKQWVVPVLEKIEMADTHGALGCAEGHKKNNPGEEKGMCGQGS